MTDSSCGYQSKHWGQYYTHGKIVLRKRNIDCKRSKRWKSLRRTLYLKVEGTSDDSIINQMSRFKNGSRTQPIWCVWSSMKTRNESHLMSYLTFWPDNHMCTTSSSTYRGDSRSKTLFARYSKISDKWMKHDSRCFTHTCGKICCHQLGRSCHNPTNNMIKTWLLHW